jgi:glutamate-1-semialdehyde 2,1-aminomutase
MIDRDRILRFRAAEEDAFRSRFAASGSVADQARAHWHDGVPFHWMRDWPSPWPLVAATAEGATLTTVDGVTLDDFCLGDTASMFGHAPPPVAEALAAQALRGFSYMLPMAEGLDVSARLAAIFGHPYWQVTSTASEANRAVIRWCRAITGRTKILIFNGCYHGAVDDVFVDLQGGAPVMRASLLGQVADIRGTTVVVEFNDSAALDAALAGGDIACILAEPVMTNVGMVLPQPGFLDHVRDAATRAGTLLVWDETHTVSSGLGGHGRAHGPLGDMIVVGKAIAGGMPTAVYGFSADVAARMAAANAARPGGHSGIGTTLSANALAIQAMRAMLNNVMTADNYAHMLAGADRLVAGLRRVVAAHRLDWQVAHVGARVEFITNALAIRNGSDARAAMDHDLEGAIHLGLVNRGLLLAPFHNMALVSPVTSDAQIDRLAAGLDEVLTALEGA